ncbi:hypothetical protein MMC10_009407 [Thelotrema lepadinum]|nr:hypothetical protein [Thelotrema lepadinum]
MSERDPLLPSGPPLTQQSPKISNDPAPSPAPYPFPTTDHNLTTAGSSAAHQGIHPPPPHLQVPNQQLQQQIRRRKRRNNDIRGIAAIDTPPDRRRPGDGCLGMSQWFT